MLRWVRWAAIATFVFAGSAWGVVWRAQHNPAGPAAALVRLADTWVSGQAGGHVPFGTFVGGPFTLIDGTGQVVTDATFRGRWMLLYFGYTFCPDVCPTTLQTIASVMDEMGSASNVIIPIFITVDPDRDTSETVRQYAELFDQRLVGLTGTSEQIAVVTREYRVFHKMVITPGSTSYLVDHSSLVYLVNPGGRFVRLFPPETTVKEMADGIAEAMMTERRGER